MNTTHLTYTLTESRIRAVSVPVGDRFANFAVSIARANASTVVFSVDSEYGNELGYLSAASSTAPLRLLGLSVARPAATTTRHSKRHSRMERG